MPCHPLPPDAHVVIHFEAVADDMAISHVEGTGLDAPDARAC